MLVEYHRTMLEDKVRNNAFKQALTSVIVKGKSTVADIGCGTGVLGMIASRLGARQVYMYEFSGISTLAKKLIRDNKIKNCHLFETHTTDMIDPPMVDVIVAEVLGNFALEENIIETINDARRFLKPGGTVIPSKITQYACPVISPRFNDELDAWNKTGLDLDFTSAREMSYNNIYVRSFKKDDLLGDAKTWDIIDLYKKNTSKRAGKIFWDGERETTIFGIALWWECALTAKITLSTSPLAPKTHWEQLYLPLQTPVHMKKGDSITVSLSSTSSYQAGTNVKWQVTHKSKSGRETRQSHDLEKGFIG